MREVSTDLITKEVARLCIEANRILPNDIKDCLDKACCTETSELGKNVLCDLVRNYQEAQRLSIPVCQDTGMAVVFVSIGQEVHIIDGDFTKAVNDGVALGYTQGLLRCSVVDDPLQQ